MALVTHLSNLIHVVTPGWTSAPVINTPVAAHLVCRSCTDYTTQYLSHQPVILLITYDGSCPTHLAGMNVLQNRLEMWRVNLNPVKYYPAGYFNHVLFSRIILVKFSINLNVIVTMSYNLVRFYRKTQLLHNYYTGALTKYKNKYSLLAHVQ